MEVNTYQVKIRFSRLFADPAVFDEPSTLAQRYLTSTGLSQDKADFIQQATEDAIPLDDSGKPSVAAGEANYRYQGKSVRTEYMAGANLNLEYVDFGSGLSLQDHKSGWGRGRWGELGFQLKEIQQRRMLIELPDVSELYQMLVARSEPTTLASIELESIPDNLFQPTASFVEARLKGLAQADGSTVEVYAARGLATGERTALEKRLTREIGSSSLLVILSKEKRNPQNSLIPTG